MSHELFTEGGGAGAGWRDVHTSVQVYHVSDSDAEDVVCIGSDCVKNIIRERGFGRRRWVSDVDDAKRNAITGGGL